MPSQGLDMHAYATRRNYGEVREPENSDSPLISLFIIVAIWNLGFVPAMYPVAYNVGRAGSAEFRDRVG